MNLRPELCATLARALPHWPAEPADLRIRALDILVEHGDVWLAVFHAEELLKDPRGGDISAADEEAQRRLTAVLDADDVLRSFAHRVVGRMVGGDEAERGRVCSILRALGSSSVEPLIDAPRIPCGGCPRPARSERSATPGHRSPGGTAGGHGPGDARHRCGLPRAGSASRHRRGACPGKPRRASRGP